MDIVRSNLELQPNPYKSAFTGAGGVGKTALLENVRAEINDPSSAVFITEVARTYFAAHPRIPQNQRYSYRHQSRIQEAVMDREEMAHNPNLKYGFTDRSVFDAAVCVASTGDEKGAKILFERARMWQPGNSEIAYSQIYLLDPADVPFENDAQRTENAATRQAQHEMFIEFFTSHNIVHKLLSGTLEQRTQEVLAGLPNYQSNKTNVK